MDHKKLKDLDAYLTGLTLENFKSIVGPITIDFAPLTLFFGPNSSGKSSIYSALVLMTKLLSLNQYSRSYENLLPFIHRQSRDLKTIIGIKYHCRDFLGPLGESDHPSPIRYSNDQFTEAFLKTDYSFSARIDRPGFDVEVFHEITSDSDSSYYHLSLIKFDGDNLVRLDHENIDIFLDHYLVKTIQEDLELQGFSMKSLLQKVFPYFEHKEIDNVLRCDISLFINGATFHYMDEQLERNLINSIEKTLADMIFGLLIGLPLHHALQVCKNVLHLGPVRQIPSPSDLTFLYRDLGVRINEHKYYDLIPSDNQKNLLWDDGGIAWQYLAGNIIKDVTSYVRSFGPEPELCLFDTVNNWLVSEQRLGLQHKVVANVGLISRTMPTVTSSSDANHRRFYVDGVFPDAVVKLELEDVNIEIPVAVNSVGVGVPQLTPVLVAGLVGNIVFIEQPELHLHPKVQTEIADFFLHCFNDRQTRFIIETHSEHLALRILRRIRETNSAHIKHRDFSITENDVAFYYFDHANGVTEVKQLRVSPNGDFLDRWPKGFFAEREAELFDEDD